VSIANLPEPPYSLGGKCQSNIVEHWWIFESSGAPFDVEVLQCPPLKKNFQICEIWAGSVSTAVIQGEAAGFEISDPAAGISATYVYKGVGLTIGLPGIPKVGNAINSVKDALSHGGVSGKGPINDFSAPGYLGVNDFEGDATLQTIYNLGLGTDKSANVFDFGFDYVSRFEPPRCLIGLSSGSDAARRTCRQDVARVKAHLRPIGDHVANFENHVAQI